MVAGQPKTGPTTDRGNPSLLRHSVPRRAACEPGSLLRRSRASPAAAWAPPAACGPAVARRARIGPRFARSSLRGSSGRRRLWWATVRDSLVVHGTSVADVANEQLGRNAQGRRRGGVPTVGAARCRIVRDRPEWVSGRRRNRITSRGRLRFRSDADGKASARGTEESRSGALPSGASADSQRGHIKRGDLS